MLTVPARIFIRQSKLRRNEYGGYAALRRILRAKRKSRMSYGVKNNEFVIYFRLDPNCF